MKKVVELFIYQTLLVSFLLLPLNLAHSQEQLSLGAMKSLYKRPSSVPFPKANQPNPARIKLGKMLFFDPRLSGSNIMSCATCHNPSLSWGDGLPLGVGHGHKKLDRKTPTVLNQAWSELQFWDGRAASLEEQALSPIESKVEMNQNLDELEKELKAIKGYKMPFRKAYPGLGINRVTIGKALAAFQRTIVSGESQFDRFIEGERGAISRSALHGFILFNNKAGCFECHSGWNFTDSSFHDIGLKSKDLGRGKILPQLELMKHAFKVPTLRNIAQRSPYMHDGSLNSLEEVIDFYDRGGDKKRVSLSDLIRPLKLTKKEKKNLLIFLKTLTGKDALVSLPILPR